MISLVLALTLASAPAMAAPAYLRFPDLHGDTLVFSAAGDLWTANVAQGGVSRLTSHSGDERFAQISPDGKTVAFTGAYDGNLDVYVVPITGGQPRRLTWHPGTDEVVGWTADGQVLMRTRALEPNGEYQLYTLPTTGGEPALVPLGWSARLAADPTTGLWAFNRIAHERATWKRYRGGMNADLWVGDPKKQDYVQVTDFTGMDDFPMWWQSRIYFLSDRGGTYDIWSIKADGSDAKRHTDGGEWDARYPSQAPDGRIVYTRAGEVWVFDPSAGKETKLSIDVPLERNLARRRYPWGGDLDWFHLSPDGDRLAISTRGEVFSVPTDDGVTLPVTRGSGARERYPVFSPDGKRVAYVTDASGEQAIMVADAWGRGDAVQVGPAGGWRFPISWSPDGKRIAWADNTQSLFIATVPPPPAKSKDAKSKDKAKDAAPAGPIKVDHSEQWEIAEYAWSPDGRWLAYTKYDRRDFRSIWLYDTTTGKSTRATGGNTDDYAPAWDPEGRYLYFLSDRHINPLLGGRDFQVIFGPSSKPFLLLLRPDVENPLTPKVGLPEAEAPVVKEKAKRKKRREKDEGAEEGPKPVNIELEHLAERAVPLPVPAGVYSTLMANADRLFFLSHPNSGMAEDSHGDDMGHAALMAFDLEEKEASVFMAGVYSYELAARGEKLAVMAGMGGVAVIGADSPPGDLSDAAVDLSHVVVELDPQEEWRQIYYEGWRLMRDFYWDPGMAGVDWQAIRDRYATVLPRLSTREELRDLMGEVIGELATSHTYVWGGDDQLDVDWVGVGLLGAEVQREGDAFKVTRVLRGDPADNVRAPLDEPGSKVAEGEYILAVNNRPFDKDKPFLAHFENLADQPVMLLVNSKPSREGARTVVVTPTGWDGRLRYVDWVRRNREYVEKQSGGRFGYVHIPDMGTDGMVAFLTWYFPQLDKEGLVVDVRWNGGGFVSQLILERLRRPVSGFDRARGGGEWTYPAGALNGPFVVLTNEFAGSDGDIFPHAVKEEKLAPVIGMRSWGGVIGIRADKPLVDHGMITQPEFATWFISNGWGLENHGVDPDIVVQNLPQDLAAGKDPQLDRALTELKTLHEKEPPIKPAFAPAPPRGRDAFKDETAPK